MVNSFHTLPDTLKESDGKMQNESPTRIDQLLQEMKFQIQAHSQSDVEEAERRLRLDSANQLRIELRDAGELPRGIERYRFEHCRSIHEQDDAIKKAKSWDGQGTLYFYGPNGTGKTHLGRCVLNEFMERAGFMVGEICAQDFVERCRSFDWQKTKEYRMLRERRVLLLDDLDKPIFKSEDLAKLQTVMSSRYDQGRGTIITANMTPGNLADFLADCAPDNLSLARAIVDRFEPATVVEVGGRSLRRRLVQF